MRAKRVNVFFSVLCPFFHSFLQTFLSLEHYFSFLIRHRIDKNKLYFRCEFSQMSKNAQMIMMSVQNCEKKGKSQNLPKRIGNSLRSNTNWNSIQFEEFCNLAHCELRSIVKIVIFLVYAKHSWDLRSAITLQLRSSTVADFFFQASADWGQNVLPSLSRVSRVWQKNSRSAMRNKEFKTLLFTFHHHHLQGQPGWHRCLCIAFCIKNV